MARSLPTRWWLVMAAVASLPCVAWPGWAQAVTSSDPPPAAVAVLLDTSASLKPEDLESTRRLAREVFQALPAGSTMSVFSFDDESRLLQAATNDPAAVDAALTGAQRAGRYTALNDALYDASRALRDQPGKRRAVLLLTDGKDENSALALEDGLAVALSEGIPVFAVGLGKIEEKTLRRVAKLTGGGYAPLATVTAGEVAGMIEALPERSPTATPSASVASGPAAPEGNLDAAAGRVEEPGFSTGRLLAGALAGLGLAVAVGALLLIRKKPAARPGQAGGSSGSLAPKTASDLSLKKLESMDGQHDGATLLTRLPTREAGGGTVVLKQNPMLRVKNGPGAGLLLELRVEQPTSLGRASANDVVLEDDAVSSQHCRIRFEDGQFLVHDLQSTNGTWVNERRVTKHALANGDVLRLGETLMEFCQFGK